MPIFHRLPYSSYDLPVEVEGPPLAFCPDTEILFYDSQDVVHDANTTSQNAVYERVLFRVVFDLVDYLSALVAAGLPGDFSSNFIGGGYCVTTNLPSGIPACTLEPIGGVSFSGGLATISQIIRPDESWAGQNRYLNFVLNFQHGSQTDTIVVPFRIFTAVENTVTLPTPETNPFNLVAWAKNGKQIDERCLDEPAGVIELRARHDRVGYDSLALLVRNGQVISEFDNYVSTNLPQLNQQPIIDMESSVSGGSQTEIVKINESQITDGDCVFVVIKNETPDQVPGACPSVPTTVDITITRLGFSFTKIEWDIDTLPADLDYMEVSVVRGSCEFIFDTELQTGEINLNASQFGCGFSDIHTVVVTLYMEDGCMYTESNTFTVLPLNIPTTRTFFA
jgi:hypothetical protein